MTMYLWDLAQVQAVGNAIRAKTGKSADMTVAQMPAEIANIPTGDPEIWKPCWIEKPSNAPQTLHIDTGVMANINYKMVFTCRSSIGQMSAPFNSCASSGPRYGINFLPNSNRVQIYWGGYADTGVTVDRTELDVTNDMVITQNRNGITIDGFNSNAVAVSWTREYTANAGSGTIENYKLFTYARNTSIHFGLFKNALIYDVNDTLIYSIVAEMNNKFQARLRVTDEQTSAETFVPVPAGFICHVDNEAAA